jgi:putative inorganic carbon (HCO3(-)) transporter
MARLSAPRVDRKVSKLKQALRNYDWLFLAAITPQLLFPSVERAWSLLIYPLILGLQWWSWGEVFPLTPLNPAVLLIAVMVAVSTFVTPDPASSLAKVTGVLLGILVFFTVARHSRTRQGWKSALALLALASVGVAALGVFGASWLPSKLPQINALLARLPVHLTGLPGAEAGINVNEIAGALLWVVPLLLLAGLAFLIHPKWFSGQREGGKIHMGGLAVWGILLGLAIIVCAGVLVLSQSRDGYLAIAVASPIVLLLLARGWARTFIMAWLIILVVAGVVVISHAGLETTFNQLFATLPAKGVAFSVSSLFGRAEIWRRAIWAIQDAPLSGLGMNIFRKAIYLQAPPFQNPGFDIAHAHDELLQASLDLGLPGLVALLALYIGAIGMLVRAIRGRGVWHWLALGVFGGLLAHFLFGITDAVALGAKPGFLLWWLFGLAFGIYYQVRPIKVTAV